MSPASPPFARLSLSARLAGALVLLLGILLAVVSTYLVPRTADAFLAHGDALVRDGTRTARELVEQQTIGVRTVLTDLIRHGGEARRHALDDQPIELCNGDAAAIRSTLAADDAQRNARQQESVQRLAREMIGRSERTLETRIAELTARQRDATARFASEQRTTHLLLVVASLVALLAVLGFGLHRYVVLPTQRLRLATQRVAAGDLATPLPPPAGGELGDLARDFASMVAQLQTARADLQQLAAGLEDEVARKTAHLEQALADLRNSHRQLAQAERLASLGTLAGGIAHEFHNVIGGIRGCTGELLADEPSADRRETLGVIQRAADRASGIVQQLLRFARRSVEHQGPVDLAAVAEDALRLCEPAARRQSVAVERTFAPGTIVRGDADGLHQVLVNLLTNALQAMPDGGSLAVSVAARPDAAVLTVADTGTGIAETDLPHVFEPFFTTKTHDQDHRKRGTGLGLSVSYGIVTAHGGRIEVASTPGRGTTFTITLPRPATTQSR